MKTQERIFEFILVAVCFAFMVFAVTRTIDNAINHHIPTANNSYTVQNPESVAFERRNASRELLKLQMLIAEQERKK